MSESATTNNQDLIEAARTSVDIEPRIHVLEMADYNGDAAHIPLAIGADGGVGVMKDVIAELDRGAAGPRRRTGEVVLGALADFIAFVNRFKTPDVVVFAPLSPPGVTAIFDFHPASEDAEGAPTASWCQDRASYRCPLSRQWKLWTELDGKPFTLVMKDEHAETSTKIPPKFALLLPVFEGDEDHYIIEARVRFAMVDGRPQFAYVLQNKERVLEDALAALRAKVAAGTGAPVFVGTPPAAR